MDQVSVSLPVATTLRPETIGPLDGATVARLAGAGGDLTLVIDRNGTICDVAVSDAALRIDGCDNWINKRWSDTVTKESQPKVEEMLREALSNQAGRWRELNHPTRNGEEVAMRYIAVEAGKDGRVVAIGRDHRAAASLQQRLLQAQQAMERDYARMRESETRYRLLYQMMAEGVLIVDASSRRVSDSNPAADRLLGGDGSLIGRPFSRLFSIQHQEDAVAVLSSAQASPSGSAQAVRMIANGRPLSVAATVFREGRSTLFLVRVSSAEATDPTAPQSSQDMLEALDQLPDSFVVTDRSMAIIAQNSAFLDLARLPGPGQSQGQSLTRFLGRQGLDRNLLLETLLKHTVVRNFPTVFRTELGDLEDVEVSAVALSGSDASNLAFSIRPVSRRSPQSDSQQPQLPHTSSEFTELVGKVSLKDIVRDTTDYVERLCVEAALEMTGNNRASAAEVLGLSRQSLYSKLNRFGIINSDET